MSDNAYYELFQQCKLERDITKAQLVEAVEVIEFYAEGGASLTDDTSQVQERFCDRYYFVSKCGDRARQFLAKLKGSKE